ncbi:NAD(P)-dependent dehydrogenase (short-subunit alcohol dehydrogenase family) [Scopulibacillus daqui]|uniref:NAD(P)-dependent dehydrogenase (Short-subunit alcohol dehydrogenase family) n=1 Tax=Scopulibacillus daqui TaxID=1469162 RepID=A0ABS2PXV0_9BACL|nr:3-(cis-5,6-dihydroxycyclohexa-1,3-dien-1-yl)propanoate dehydrogenase [Scopulibacillus daqui]MBM7644883.1 NAD(P)-dependent dehydrogenase (short-subunit alcohol dehydrogenase family) [Scopulibacillus daqui]
MGWLQNKTALITGGGSGIGRAVVKRFIQEGAKVCILDISESKLQSLNDEFGSDVISVCGDVRHFEDNQRAVSVAVETFGKLDHLVLNAGIFDGFKKLTDLSPEVIEKAYHEILDINVKGCLLGVKAALPELKKRKGTIIFSVSGASFYPDGGGVLYTASKHAELGLLRQMAFELAPDIRVNGVALGGTITELSVAPSLKPYYSAPSVNDKKESIRNRNPLKMFMEPEHHVASYVLLASDQSQAITGEVISSDGGLGVRGLS